MSDVIPSGEGEVVTGPFLGPRGFEPEARSAKPYDFRKPDKFSREQLRVMGDLSEGFARLAATRLSATLRLPCAVELRLVDQMTFGEFTDPLKAKAVFAVTAMRPLEGRVVMHLEAAGTEAVVERLFGARPPERTPASALAAERVTDIEIAALERVLGPLAADLGAAWSPVERVEGSVDGIETEARFCQVVPPNEMIVLTSFDVSLGAAKARLDVAYPFLTLEAVLPRLSPRFWYARSLAGSGDTRDALSSAACERVARRAEAEAAIAIGLGGLSVGRLRALRRGSVIELPSDGQAWLRLGGAPVARLREPRAEGDSLIAAFAEPASTERDDEASALARDIRQGLSDLRTGLSDAVAALGARIDELKGGQEDLSDRVLYGQADAAADAARGPFSSLSSDRGEQLALLVAAERPQLAAMLVAFLDDAFGARLLSLLPEAMRPEVARRLASMDRVAPETLALVEGVLDVRLSAMARPGFAPGGVDKLASVLNHVPRQVEAGVIGALDRADPSLSEAVKRVMFVFEDLVLLDDESVALVLERADERDVVVAMKPVAEEIRERLFARFPEGRRLRLREAFEALGRLRLKDCDEAGQRVVAVIRGLEEEGLIGILREG